MRNLFLITFVSISSMLYAADKAYNMGEKIYMQTCVSCHGKNGKAQTGMKLIVKPRDLSLSILTQEQSYKIIKKGAHYWGASADIMPAFEHSYSDEELKSVAYYISKRFNPNVKERIKKLYAQSAPIPEQKRAKMLKRGKKIYKRNCSWCHGTTAQGDGEATHNPELSIFPYNLQKTLLDEQQMFLYAKYGGYYWGTYKNDMPNWSPKYDDFTLKSVIFYVEKTFRQGK